ncbi:NAD(P)H-dependent flavin oxidoreductase [Sanyastnella coralliicola]|uniref:NAD(P)H-dependent flavin oxidoreductase n=1 Tax=Sanyastnella coralliicola TaxID=3069118 RepID=UPI0027B90F22|nr:nitronate monooxygenase [Longitalea sp. SCSIO 12813]
MNRLSQLLNIKYPIIQAGMVWCSGWELAAASSKAGILGTIGAGSMYPEVLLSHIAKCKAAGETNFAVNLPLLYPQIEEHIKTILEQEVPVVITSAGNPKKWTSELKSKGVIVGHVVSSKKFALKAQDAGVDFIIAEGFEAGGHNGREETTTMCLIPEVADAIEIPLAAAGGIADARSMVAAMVLGADGVQIGSRFVASKESSAHENFKSSVVEASEGQTELTLKELTPVRLLEGGFLSAVREAYANDASAETLKELLGRGRAKKGMFEGDLQEGELEIGQVSSRIDEILSVEDIVKEIISDYRRMNPQGLGDRFQLT